jgi:hypothetical protein
MRWAGELPEEITAQIPGLCLGFGWAAHATGQPQQSAKYIQWVEQYCGLTAEQFLSMPLMNSTIAAIIWAAWSRPCNQSAPADRPVPRNPDFICKSCPAVPAGS